MTAADLIKLVREEAVKRPDNFYAAEGDSQCSYTKGTCCDGTIGCLLGQILEREFPGVFWDSIDTKKINVVLEHLHIPASKAQGRWLNDVQMKQDQRHSWKVCVEWADRLLEERAVAQLNR